VLRDATRLVLPRLMRLVLPSRCTRGCQRRCRSKELAAALVHVEGMCDFLQLLHL
jgi:hypothetical protein